MCSPLTFTMVPNSLYFPTWPSASFALFSFCYIVNRLVNLMAVLAHDGLYYVQPDASSMVPMKFRRVSWGLFSEPMILVSSTARLPLHGDLGIPEQWLPASRLFTSVPGYSKLAPRHSLYMDYPIITPKNEILICI